MINTDFDFEDWFATIALYVLDHSGFELRDQDSVRGDYDQGRSAIEVAEEISAEYRGAERTGKLISSDEAVLGKTVIDAAITKAEGPTS